jgi:hypothetical protein
MENGGDEDRRTNFFILRDRTPIFKINAIDATGVVDAICRAIRRPCRPPGQRGARTVAVVRYNNVAKSSGVYISVVPLCRPASPPPHGPPA